MGLMITPALIEISFYFERKRALAMGIAMAGAGTGVFSFAPLAGFLNDELGWQNAHYVYGKKQL